jgi:hypothetical protein
MGFLVLWGFRYLERHVERDQLAQLKISAQGSQLLADELHNRLIGAYFRIKSLSVTTCIREHQRTFACEVRWPSLQGNVAVPPLVAELEQLRGVIEVEWSSLGPGPE